MLSLIAAGLVLLARQDLVESQRDARRAMQALWLEGEAVQATVKIMETQGRPVMRWTELSPYGAVTVIVEPEDRKIAPQYADRLENLALISKLVEQGDADEAAAGLIAQTHAAPAMVERSTIAHVNQDRRWRDCATTLFSPYSRLTDLALDEPGVVLPVGKAFVHTGEIWRVQAVVADGGWIDQVVRLTGRTETPVDVLEQADGQDRMTGRAGCWALLKTGTL